MVNATMIEADSLQCKMWANDVDIGSLVTYDNGGTAPLMA